MKTSRFLLAALALSAAPLLAADDYAVRLTRPMKVGDRYRLDAKGTNHEQQRISFGGQVQNEDKDISVHLVAVATVLSVDTTSQPTRIEYLVESCRRTAAGKTDDVLPAGRKIVAELNERNQTVFAIDGDPALEDTSEALNVVLSAHEPGSPTDDEIFGTRARRKIGDRWPINSRLAASYYSRSGLKVAEEDLKGDVSLDGVQTIGGVEALAITAHMTAGRMTMELPEWLRIEKSSLSGDFGGFVPADPKAPDLLSDKLQMHMNFVMTGRKPETGSDVKVEYVVERSLENAYSAAPPGPAPTPARTPTPAQPETTTF
jgi:hypothetical protein